MRGRRVPGPGPQQGPATVAGTAVAVDHHVVSGLGLEDDVLKSVARRTAAAGLPDIAVSAPMGAYLCLTAKMIRAHRILEVGCLGGYSTLWLARGMATDGRIVGIDRDPAAIKVTSETLSAGGMSDQSTLIEEDALTALDGLVADGTAPFDLVFLDAAKSEIPAYLSRCLTLTKPGSVIIIDNMVRGGALMSPETNEAGVGIAQALKDIAANDQIEATILQTVGAKGYDGFAMLWVR